MLVSGIINIPYETFAMTLLILSTKAEMVIARALTKKFAFAYSNATALEM